MKKLMTVGSVLALAMTVVAAETKEFNGSTSLDLADAGAASADYITISGSAQYGTVTNAAPLAVAGVNIYPNSTYELVDGTSLTLSYGMLVNGSSPLYPALFKRSRQEAGITSLCRPLRTTGGKVTRAAMPSTFLPAAARR